MVSKQSISESITQDRTQKTAEEQWADFSPITTGKDYLERIRNRGTLLYLFGKKVAEPADHPIIKPSINALKKTYDLAIENPNLATAFSM